MKNNKSVIYGLLDFEINSEQRSVCKNSVPLKLSKKSFDMLLVLLQRHRELVTKEELIASVWPNQIITDDALYKQITRLRSFFESANVDKPVIETIRGIGIKLIPSVTILTAEISDPPENSSEKKVSSMLILSTIIIISLILMGISFLKFYESETGIQNNVTSISTIVEPINIAIVPAHKTQDWLNIGGLNYLSELLQRHNKIQTIKPQIDWFDNDDSSVLALELSQTVGIDYTLIVQNVLHNEKFSGHVTLRNKNNILAKNIIEATTLFMLFEKMNSWTNQQLNISSNLEIEENTTNSNELSNYALESYLRGVSSAQNRNFEKAAQFLQTAINQNQSYFSAWLLLAQVQSELGHYQKALAITDTIENLNDFDQSLLNELYNVKARVLIYQNNLDSAAAYLQKSIRLSEQNNDMKAMIVSLSSQALIHDRNAEINQETLEIMQKQLALIEKYNPLPNQIAQLNHNLAIAHQHLFDYKMARSHIDKAILQYKKSNNNTGLLSSYRVLSLLHYDLAETGEALLVLDKAENLLATVDAPITIGYYYMSYARNLMQQGYRQQAQQSIDKLNQFSITYANNQPKVIALTIQTELQILYGDIDSAKTTMKQLLAIISINPEDYPADAPYIVALDMYISARFESTEQAREKVKNYLANYPSLKSYILTELRRVEAHILAKEGYRVKSSEILHSLMNDYLESNHILDAMYIGYEILEIQWQRDMDDYLKTLNLLQELATFDYPILKFRAQYRAYKNDYINAAILMQELKPKAREFWTVNDQLLLEDYQEKSQQPFFK